MLHASPGLPAVEMPSGRREPNGSLRPSSSTAKRRGPVLNWLDGRLYVESKSGAVFSVLSTQEPGYIVLHSQQTDRWYSLPVELDAQASPLQRRHHCCCFPCKWLLPISQFIKRRCASASVCKRGCMDLWVTSTQSGLWHHCMCSLGKQTHSKCIQSACRRVIFGFWDCWDYKLTCLLSSKPRLAGRQVAQVHARPDDQDGNDNFDI